MDIEVKQASHTQKVPHIGLPQNPPVNKVNIVKKKSISMGTDGAETLETATSIHTFKVHRLMCTELMQLVDRISRIFPEIEAARPRCSTGIQALCTLNRAIEKAHVLLQYCCESSKLYLAVTGDVILSRFTKTKSLLEQSLRQIHDIAPVMLAVEISQIVEDLSAAAFVLDPYEEEAGKVIRELLQKGTSASDSAENGQVKALQIAASRLHIASPTSVLIERRSIKRLLDKVDENDSTKKKMLTYFLYLFKKYGNFIISDQTESSPASYLSAGYGSVNNRSDEMEPYVRYNQYGVQTNLLRRAVPPDEFRCPISSRLMYDPVVIASGQTYERMWIQRWFDEGHDTCPKTNMKLTQMSLTPNIGMKESIVSWCAQNGIVLSDPCMETGAMHSWDTSVTSFASLGSSMNDLRLPIDFSNISLGFLDVSFNSDSSRTDNSSDRFQSNADIAETDLEFLSKLGELCWESRCKVVEDVKSHLNSDDKACCPLSPENFVEPLTTFLRDAWASGDIKAQRDGLQLLLTFVTKNRNGIHYLREDAFDLLASFLDSELTDEVFAIVEILSGYAYCRPKITASGLLPHILRALDSHITGSCQQSIMILYNLSSNHDICSQIASLDCIPKLVSLIRKKEFVGKCLFVMKNLCNAEEARASVAETSGCIALIAEVLDNGSSEEQEDAVDILLSLCSQRIEYCELVMDEGIVPPLVKISINGTDRSKVSALELLRQLRDIRHEPECPDHDAVKDSSNHTNERKSSEGSRFFERISVFSKNNGKKR